MARKPKKDPKKTPKKEPKKRKAKGGGEAAPAAQSPAAESPAQNAPRAAETPRPANTPDAGAQPVRAPQPADQPLVVNAQYIKDLSFEAPAAPEVFQRMQTTRPDITINIDVQAVPLKDTAYEVLLNMRAECKVDQKVAFIMELVYAGNFNVRVPREHLQAVLLVECPRLLFPFARSILAEISREGGFPPVLLGPVDFVAMFQKQMERAGTAGGAPRAQDGTPRPGGDGSPPAN